MDEQFFLATKEPELLRWLRGPTTTTERLVTPGPEHSFIRLQRANHRSANDMENNKEGLYWMVEGANPGHRIPLLSRPARLKASGIPTWTRAQFSLRSVGLFPFESGVARGACGAQTSWAD